MYLNLIQIAESFGVAEKVVEDWIRRENLPHVLDRGRLLFDRARVVHWAAAHGLMARAGFLTPEQGAFTTGLALAPMLERGGIWREIESSHVLKVLEGIIDSLPGVSVNVRGLLRQRLWKTGGVNWAPVGGGTALPHFSSRVTLGRESGVIALLLLNGPLAQAYPPDGLPVTRLFFFVPPSPRAHLDTLGRLGRAIARGSLGGKLERGASDEELVEALRMADTPGGGEPPCLGMTIIRD